jgi:hypothetical protein
MDLYMVGAFLKDYCGACIDKNDLSNICLIDNPKSVICGCIIHDFRKQLEPFLKK